MELKDFIEEEDFYKALEKSLNRFIQNDYDKLIGAFKGQKSIHEMVISCKIAFYLNDELTAKNFLNLRSLSLDVERNKMGFDEKAMYGIHEDCSKRKKRKKLQIEDGAKSVRPDIIIHERGKLNNYCVFEIKKSELDSCDEIKLSKFTDTSNYGKFKYKYGIGISNFKDKTLKLIIYKEGIEKEKITFPYSKI